MSDFEKYDWRDQTRQGFLHAYMVPPANINDTLGELRGIDWAASTISSGYYTDTRTSGQLTLYGRGDEYVAPSFIRIVYEIPEWDYTREIGTYAVKAAPATRKNGQWKTTLELHSMLYTMSLDLAAKPLVLAPTSMIYDVFVQILSKAKRQFDLHDANNRFMLRTQTLESGQSQLARMYALCEISNNRLDVDGHGRVTVTPYVSPGSKTPVYTIDLSDPRGIAHDDVTRTSNFFELPSESTVVFKFSWTENGKTESREISSTAYVESDSAADSNTRGFNVTDFHGVTELSPFTQTRAYQLAREFLTENSHESIEWSLTTKYLPIWEGDVVELVVPGNSKYAGSHKCLVKNADFSGPYMDVKLTLKELTGGE